MCISINIDIAENVDFVDTSYNEVGVYSCQNYDLPSSDDDISKIQNYKKLK